MKLRSLFFLSLFAAVMVASRAVAQEVAINTEDASVLLKEMAKNYAAATSYSDVSTAIYRNRDQSERLTVKFRIWLARPGNFRVDAESTRPGGKVPRREVLWTDGVTIRRWASDKAVSILPKVQIAGSGMFGTYAYHVPTLLQADYGMSQRLSDLARAEVVNVEAVEGVECHHLRGRWGGDQYEVWLGKDDLLVRKIVAKYADHTLEEIHREIAVDSTLPSEVFRFAPEQEQLPKKP